jgi:hypothetical protein
VAANTVVGAFSSTDQDSGNTFTYSLVTGAGSTDNGAFTIVGNQLQINSSPDFETKSSYNIRVRTTDQSGLSFEKALTLSVNDLNDAPTDLALSASSVNENVAANTVVGAFSSTDQDSGNTFTYSLVTGTGSPDNGAFTIVGNQLRINSSPDFETQNSYSIRVRTTDQGGLFFEKTLAIGINNINEVQGTDGSDVLVASSILDDIQGLAGDDIFNISIASLNGGDSFNAGVGVDIVNFSGGSTTQVLTLDLSAVNQLTGVATPAITGALPVFSGFEQVSLAGFSGRGVLTGNNGDNTLIGSARKDSLTGGEGVDIFGINALNHSLLANFDVITDYASQDRIDAPGTIPATPTTPITITSSSGNATSLTSSAIATVLTSAVFTANSARAFTVTGQTGTFIALNNASAGFSSSADAIIHLSNYTIGVDNPVTII